MTIPWTAPVSPAARQSEISAGTSVPSLRRKRTAAASTLSPPALRASRASPSSAPAPSDAAAKSPAKERWTQSAALAKPRRRASAGFASSIVPWAETSRTPAGSASSRRREARAAPARRETPARREQRGAQGARQRDQSAGALGDQTVGGEVDDLGGDALDRTTRDHQHRTLGPQIVDQPQQIARPDPGQLVLGEDGAETPRRDRPRQRRPRRPPPRSGPRRTHHAAAGRGARDRPRCRRRRGSAAGGSSAPAKKRRRRLRPPQGGQGAPRETSASAQNSRQSSTRCCAAHPPPMQPVACVSTQPQPGERASAPGGVVRRGHARASRFFR